jgi:hypothetical protein
MQEQFSGFRELDRGGPDHISSPQTLRQAKIATFFRGHLIAMRTALVCPLLFIGLAFCTQALAGAGTTSAGVTTSGGNGNEPSTDVTEQSTGFVQQNQQLQNAQAPNGMALPAGATGAQGGSTTAGNSAAGAADKDPSANPDAPAAAAAPAVPPPPPPPPPIYQSAIKHLDRRTASAATAATALEPAVPPVPKAPPRPASLQPPPTAPKPAAPNAPRENARRADKAVEHPAQPAVTGGRGAAPDGYTFYSGLTLAGALLAFGLFTFLRIGHDETK